tara:strand:+ start:708 stop:1901 length:1194 start_codon:yes stop_codon:yes gene_type:complete
MAVDKKIKDDTARAVQSFFRARTLENIQNFGLAPLDAIFGVLEGKGSDQIAQSAASVMAQKHGLSFAEKAEIEKEAREDIQKAEEKLQTEYGKLSKAVLDAESNEEKAYYNQLGKFASARGSLAGRQINVELQSHKEQMADLETEDAMTDETKAMTRSIRAAAKANSSKPDDEFSGKSVVDQDAYKAYVEKQVELVINDEGIEESQKEILIRNLRPSLPDDSPSLEILEGDTVQDSEEVARQKAELRDEFRNRIRTKYGTGSSSMMRKAEERLQKASDKRIQALSDFQKKNPISKAFGDSETIKAATSQIEQVRALPERDFRSRQIATQLAQREDVQPFLQGAPSVRKGLKGLLTEYKSQQMATKRPKLPAPPTAVFGAESQVAVDEEPDGTNPAAT